MTFPDALRVMLRPDKADRDRAKLPVSFFHETTGAGLRDELGHGDAGGVSRVGQGRTGLDQTEQILRKGGKVRFAQHFIRVARSLANFARRSHGNEMST